MEGGLDGGVEGIATAVAGVGEDVEAAGGPVAGESPWGFERAADIVAAVDEDAGDAVEFGGVADELFVFEKGGVSPVMGDESREAESEFRVGFLKGGTMAGGEGDVGVFPDAPFEGGAFSNSGVGVEEERGVGIDQGEVVQIFGDEGGEAVPLFGEEGADASGDPIDFAS